jgi:acetyltransferase-like isoleucine patch superfamily enzyme
MQIIRQVGLKRVIRYAIFSIWQCFFDLLPFSPLRVFWLRFGGAEVGANSFIDKIDFINLDRTGLKGLSIGSHCFIGRGSLLDLAGQITLQDWVTVSPRATILSHMTVGFKGHPLLRFLPVKIGHTVIKQGSFIGARAVILTNCQLGPQTAIGAGAVVTKNIPPRTLATGIPAKVKKRFK